VNNLWPNGSNRLNAQLLFCLELFGRLNIRRVFKGKNTVKLKTGAR
jgi:hypothetical protein